MKIVIASGGTLGHLMPIIPVVKKLRELNYEVILYTSKKLNFDESLFNKIINYKAYGLSKNLYKSIYKNYLVYKEIKRNLKNESPNLIIGMGGYISGITILAGSKINIKTIIHEQNSVIGTSNKLVLNKVDYLIYSNEYLNVNIKNKLYLPNPRSEVAYNFHKITKRNDKQILIVSGSLGAKNLNEIGIKLSKELTIYNVILITGNRYYNEYKKYECNNLKVIPSTKNLIKLICESYLVISRAGATTISEILGSKTVGIYIPSPNVTKNHQYKNCKMLIDNNLGMVINEKDIKDYNIVSYIYKVLNNYELYQNNLNKLKFNNVVNDYIKVIGDIL